MAVTLKNPEGQIPNGLRFMQPETGWDSTVSLGTFPSMDTLTRGVIDHRAGNPWLIQKHGWSVDFSQVKREMQEYNARICLEHGWLNFIITDEQPNAVPALPQKKTLLSDGVAGVKRVAAGVGVFLDWIGAGGIPVSEDVAKRRAGICADCPKNDGGDWKKYFTEPIAAKIKQQLEIKHDLQLKTPKDSKLTVCSACDCPLQLKVWTPMEHILNHMSVDTMAKLDSRCWILKQA
jgi:hypothetical protein